MKNKYDRKTAAFLLFMVVSMVLCSGCGKQEKDRNVKEQQTLTLWYSQSNMKDYLEQAASAYKDKYQVTITCEYKENSSYLEELYQSSVQEENGPDLYLLRNDKLGRVCMEGLAAVNTSKKYDNKHYCDTALQAAEYQNSLMAYPLYFNTVCMLYHTEYFPAPPATMGAVTAFSEKTELGENTQYILYWDMNDYFCSYPFIGNYLNIGGNAGDDKSKVSIYNEQVICCLQQFQQLGQYFAVDGGQMQAEEALTAFAEGRALCILADSDMVHQMESYGELQYQICAVPDLNEELKSCAGAYTELAVVNGLGFKQEQAAEFAQFLSYDYAEHLYETTGHFAARRDISYQKQELSEMYKIYEQSKQFPKLPETEDLNLNLNVLFANVRKGSDISAELQGFAGKMEIRMNK